MKPTILIHMIGSIDGGLHPSRYTTSPDGDRRDWSALYEEVHGQLAGDAWMVGRVTMAELSKAAPHPPSVVGEVERPVHIAHAAKSHAIALDRSGKLHFDRDAIDGDHIVVLLGHDVPDSHLAELAADGVSYIVAHDETMDLAALADQLGCRFGVRRLLLEGGGSVNGSMLAAGLVDEISLLLVPAVDGGADLQGIITHDGGLVDKVRLSLRGAETLAHGVVHLRYAVQPAGAGEGA